MTTTRHAFIKGLGALALVGLATAAVPARAADSVTLRLDFLPSGYHAPLFLGLARGHYAKQDITLQIADGRGTNATLQAVAAGNDMIGIGNYSTMIQAIGQGMPVVGIGGLIQRLPDSIIAPAGSGIRTPKDLEGKSMSIPPTSAVFRLFPAFAAAAGIDASKVRQVQMDPGATSAAMLSGQVNFTTGWAFTDALRIAKQRPIEPPIMMSDFGINVLGAGFFVTRATASGKADVLKRFMAATVQSFEEGLKEPEAAMNAMFAARPEIDKDLLLEQLRRLGPFLQTDRSKGRVLGWTAREDWAQTVDLLQKYFEMKDRVDVAALYTNDFLPAR